MGRRHLCFFFSRKHRREQKCVAFVPQDEASSSSAFKEEPSSATQIDSAAPPLTETTLTLLQPSPSQPESSNPGEVFPLTAAHLADHTQETQSSSANNTVADHDSTFGGAFGEASERSFSMTSVRSEIRKGKFENGRRYSNFRGATYHIPNDKWQQDVEAGMDRLWTAVMRRRLFLSPIQAQLCKVIDIGTGTGCWPVDMGDAYPWAHIRGVDISPIQPVLVPPNVEFILDDVQLGWRYAHKFDLVHVRDMTTSFKNWNSFLGNSHEMLKPGGWLELHEMYYIPQFKNNARKSEAQPLADFYSTIADGFKNLGIDLYATPLLADKVRSAGYVNVTENIYCIPISSDTQNEAEDEHGRLLKQIILEGLDGFALGALTRGLGWTHHEVEAWLIDPRRCLKGDLKDTTVQMHVICAQRRYDARSLERLFV